MREFRVAVVGATGAVGREMVRVLEARGFPVRELRLVASRAAGRSLPFHGESVAVRAAEPGVFADIDFALFSAGAERSREMAPWARSAGAVVIDNSSAFRMQADVPLVVPEVNATALEGHQGLIANPNCSTIQMVIPLHVLHATCGLRRVIVATYQSVSGAGSRAMQELLDDTRAVLDATPERREAVPRGIAFNCVPQIDRWEAGGATREEVKMQEETRKILGLPDLVVQATCVRVPVLRSHSEAVVADTARPVDVARWLAALARQPGVEVAAEAEAFPVPREAAGHDAVFVGRVRTVPEMPASVAFWVVADNLLKGAALNAVQIAEVLVGRLPASARS